MAPSEVPENTSPGEEPTPSQQSLQTDPSTTPPNAETSATKSHRRNKQSLSNGQPKEVKPTSENTTKETPNGTSATPKLSGAELKKQQKAEKAARREKAKADKGGGAAGGSGGAPAPPTQKAEVGKDAPRQKDAKAQQHGQAQGSGKGRPTPAGGASGQHQLPLRRRTSFSGTKEIKEEIKEVGLFGHLYGQPRRHSIEGASKEVHPAVLALGLHMSSYVICGSTARCVAMLLAFKSVIEDYTTPPGTSLARHLTSHHLSPQIDYLRSCRPISISMGNSIRWLKDLIIKIDPDVPEAAAKSSLILAIDTFIRERITAADTLIASTASSKIIDGDVILTYAKSSIVQQTLIQAHKAGTKFRVIVVDSKPLFEGKNLARTLANQGLDVQYALISAAAHAVKEASKVFLGAHAMMSNGRLYSRIGTAVIAMLANDRAVPVIVCCESLKFTEKVALDSIVGNEIAPSDEIVTGAGAAIAQLIGKETRSPSMQLLKDWRDTKNLQLLNIMYDVTPAEYIKMVITEYGSLPPSSVPVVHRLSTNT